MFGAGQIVPYRGHRQRQQPLCTVVFQWKKKTAFVRACVYFLSMSFGILFPPLFLSFSHACITEAFCVLSLCVFFRYFTPFFSMEILENRLKHAFPFWILFVCIFFLHCCQFIFSTLVFCAMQRIHLLNMKGWCEFIHMKCP